LTCLTSTHILLTSRDIVLFLSHQPCAPRHLPSFPTRRSSDLDGSDGPALHLYYARQGERVFDIAKRYHARCRDLAAANHLERDGDRKSTRLNSSHVSISYAVFCLKKKKLTLLHTLYNSRHQSI